MKYENKNKTKTITGLKVTTTGQPGKTKNLTDNAIQCVDHLYSNAFEKEFHYDGKYHNVATVDCVCND